MAENKPSESKVTVSQNDEETQFKILKFLMDYNGRYHDHKETMAWVATSFYIVGIISMAIAVRHIAFDCCSWRVLFSVFFTLAGVLISKFVCWQFNNRHIAYRKVEDYASKLAKLQIVKNTGVDLEKEEKGGNPLVPVVLTFIAIWIITAIAIILVSWY